MKRNLESLIRISLLSTIALFPLSTVLGYLGMGLTFLLAVFNGDAKQLFELGWKDKPLLLVIASFTLAIAFSKLLWLSVAIGLFVSGQMLLYLLVRAYLTKGRDIKKAILLTLLVSIVVSAIGIYQYYFTNMDAAAQGWVDTNIYKDIPSRVFSTLFNPNVLGSYLIFIIATALGCLDYANGRRGAVLGLVITIGTTCLLFTYSRGAWLGLAVSVILFLYWRKEKKYLLGIPIGLSALLYFDLPQLWSRINPLTLQHDSSTAYRLEIWQTSLRIFQDNPFWGTGMGTVWYDIASYNNNIYTFIAHAHNLYLQLAVEAGFFGLITFLILVGAVMLMNYDVYKHSRSRRHRGIALGLLVGFTGIMVQGFVDAAIIAPQFGMLFWIYSGITKNLWEIGKKNKLNLQTPNQERIYSLGEQTGENMVAVGCDK